MGKKFYLYVYCLTGEAVLAPDDVFESDIESIERLINKLIRYDLFTKIHVLGFDDNFPDKIKEFTVYSVLDRKDLELKKSLHNDMKAYLYFLSCLIAKKTHADLYLENDTVSDSEREILDKITTDCINNYINFNILDNDNLGFITVPDRVNELLDDLNVLKVLKI